MSVAHEQFIGAWRLLSCEVRGPAGQVSYPYGREVAGYILYSADGYMSVSFMSRERLRFAGDDPRRGTTEEKVAAAETYVSYCGRYEILADRVRHYVEVSFFPNWVGGIQERLFVFEGRRLTLIAPAFMVNGEPQKVYLIWEKV